MTARRAVCEVARRELVERVALAHVAGHVRAAVDPQRRRRDRRRAREHGYTERRCRSRRRAVHRTRAGDPAEGAGGRPTRSLAPHWRARRQLRWRCATARSTWPCSTVASCSSNVRGPRRPSASCRTRLQDRPCSIACAARGSATRRHSARSRRGLCRCRCLSRAGATLSATVICCTSDCLSCTSRWSGSATRWPRASPRRTSSRVVELLLTTLSPRRLLAGKVLGVGLLGLAQLLVAGGAALAAGQLAGGAGLPSAAPEAVALVLLWFVLGYAFYSVAYAAVGALVSRQEDLAGATTLLTTVLIGSFVLAMIALDNPNGTLATVAAFVPPFAPMVVPARVVLGDMSAVGLAGAVVLGRPRGHRRTDPACRTHLRASDPAHRRPRQVAARARTPHAPRRDSGPRDGTSPAHTFGRSRGGLDGNARSSSPAL